MKRLSCLLLAITITASPLAAAQPKPPITGDYRAADGSHGIRLFTCGSKISEQATRRLRLTRLVQQRMGVHPEAGAEALAFAATRPLAGGVLVGPRGFHQLKGTPGIVDAGPAATNPALAARMLAACDALVAPWLEGGAS